MDGRKLTQEQCEALAMRAIDDALQAVHLSDELRQRLSKETGVEAESYRLSLCLEAPEPEDTIHLAEARVDRRSREVEVTTWFERIPKAEHRVREPLPRTKAP